MTGTLSDQWSTSEPWTPILTPIPTQINIRVNLQLPCAIHVALQYVTNTRGEIYRHPHESKTCPLCQLPRYRYCSLFSFPCSGIPVIKSQSVWPNDDGYRNTERAQRYLSIIGGANPNLELSSYLTYFPMNPQAAVIAIQLWMTFNKPQSSWSKHEETRYSHGLRNHANVNHLCVINHQLMTNESHSITSIGSIQHKCSTNIVPSKLPA